MSRGRARAWLAWFVACNLIWLWLISGVVFAEEILGLVASAVAATAAVVVMTQHPIGFQLRARWFLHTAALPARTIHETRLVFGALADRLRGRPVEGRFRTTRVSLPSDPAESNAKQALLIAGESFAPNTYVLGIDADSGLMLIHELVAEGD